MPILVIGECCLALLGVVCAILNAAGRTRATLSFVALTVAVGAGAAAVLVPHAAVGAPMLRAAAIATALGMAAGFVVSIAYVRARLGGSPPRRRSGAWRPVGRRRRRRARHSRSRKDPRAGRHRPGRRGYLAVLVLTGELGPADRAKLARMLRR